MAAVDGPSVPAAGWRNDTARPGPARRHSLRSTNPLVAGALRRSPRPPSSPTAVRRPPRSMHCRGRCGIGPAA